MLNIFKKQRDEFIDIKFSYFNMQVYFVRKSIFNSIKKNISIFKGKLVDVGCGKMPYKEYILKNSGVNSYVGLDINNAIAYDKNIKPDIIWDGENIPIESNSIDTVIATEFFEHCPHPEIIFKEIYRILKDNGILYTTTPFIFPLHESPNDHYRYTPYSLENLAKKAGFKNTKIYPLGGINASIAQILSFWIKNKYLRVLIVPLIYILYKTDKRPRVFANNTFYTGLYGIYEK